MQTLPALAFFLVSFYLLSAHLEPVEQQIHPFFYRNPTTGCGPRADEIDYILHHLPANLPQIPALLNER
jgi:hypothetical protein